MNIGSRRTGSYQPMIANDRVFNPNGAGLDLNNQGAQGGCNSRPVASQFAPRPKVESNSIDFSLFLNPYHKYYLPWEIFLMKTLGKDFLLSLLVLIPERIQ